MSASGAPVSPLRRAGGRIVRTLGLEGLLFRFREARHAWSLAPDPPAPDGKPLPPRSLRVKVVWNPEADYFLQSGQETVAEFDAVLARTGGGFAGASQVLDLGCGCGRLARWLRLRSGAVLAGTDINPTLANWCRRHMSGEWRVNPLTGPLPFAADRFDIAYACSVVTHLREPTTAAWLAEVARVLAPGGRALITFHDEVHPNAAGLEAQLAAEGFAVRFGTLEGANHMASFVTLKHLQILAGPGLELVAAIPSPQTVCHQAIAVFRKR